MAGIAVNYAEILHIGQATLAGYGIYVSWISITNLRQYEEKSEKAAKWSNEAARQLHTTRTTQAAGMVAAVLNLGASLFLATSWHLIPRKYRILASPAMLLVTLLARGYMYNFWTEKAKVPMVDGYNEAIDKTKYLIVTLQYLEYSWVLTSLVAGVLGYRRNDWS
ncbi:hypothetical protein C1H76_8847 [Elsinoe australis]|uniref:Uncharacterized protein n=1 Tax=Elsinoe australis TaxID=40998 RepID=A0A2P7ZD18_9PEZI|nr:hypothetical protein B9Z65_5058 [Elsinoe australis]TKX18958.1 hypothetical protein C1H76_8847 [Elsinoe australis]